MDQVDPHAETAMARYLLDDEDLVAAQRQHWAAVAVPVGMAVAGLMLTLICGFSAPASFGVLTDLAWKLWFVLLVYAAVRLLVWRFDWFVATDKRLLMTYGVLNRRVAMMPLTKVTDMSFNRTVLGQLCGYGQFVLESAGQDQALRQIDFIRDPSQTYLAIVREIFGEEGQPEDEPDPTDPNLHLQLAGTGRQIDPTDVPIRPVGTIRRRPERPRRSSLRERVLRRARTDDPRAAFGHENDVGWTHRDRPRSPRGDHDRFDD